MDLERLQVVISAKTDQLQKAIKNVVGALGGVNTETKNTEAGFRELSTNTVRYMKQIENSTKAVANSLKTYLSDFYGTIDKYRGNDVLNIKQLKKDQKEFNEQLQIAEANVEHYSRQLDALANHYKISDDQKSIVPVGTKEEIAEAQRQMLDWQKVAASLNASLEDVNSSLQGYENSTAKFAKTTPELEQAKKRWYNLKQEMIDTERELRFIVNKGLFGTEQYDAAVQKIRELWNEYMQLGVVIKRSQEQLNTSEPPLNNWIVPLQNLKNSFKNFFAEIKDGIKNNGIGDTLAHWHDS